MKKDEPVNIRFKVLLNDFINKASRNKYERERNEAIKEKKSKKEKNLKKGK